MTGIIETVKEFLTSPGTAVKKVEKTTLGDDLKYYATILTVYSIFAGIFGGSYLSKYIGNTGFVTTIIGIFIGTFVMLFIWAGILHIGVKSFGGKNPYSTTLKALVYGETPNLLLGWIPVIGGLAGLWSLGLSIYNLMKLQKMTLGKTIGAYILAIIIGAIIGLLILLPVVALGFLSMQMTM